MSFKSTPPRITAQTRGSRRFQGVRPAFIRTLVYAEYYDLALSYGLDPALKPTKLDISETVRWLGYKPSYSPARLLSELAAYGDSGPPQLTEA